MPRHRQSQISNFRFRFRSEPEDPRKADPVRSVPLSQKQLRRKRKAFAWMMAKCLGVTSIVLALMIFAHHVWHQAFSLSPNFTVGEFNFESNLPTEKGGISRDKIQEVTQLRPDINVMKVNLTDIHDALCKLPQVEEAIVERFLPNRIDIRVNERTPVAWLVCKDLDLPARDSVKGRFVDANGVVFQVHSLTNQYAPLPELEFPQLSEGEKNKALTDRRALQALKLVQLFDQQPWPDALRMKKVTVTSNYALEAKLSDGADVVFDLEGLPKQIDRLTKIYQYATANHETVDSVKLISDKNTPVKFVAKQTAPEPQQPAKQAPPAAPKKAAPTTNRTASTDKAKPSRAASPQDDINAIVRRN